MGARDPPLGAASANCSSIVASFYIGRICAAVPESAAADAEHSAGTSY
jgi:hypothetical protein